MASSTATARDALSDSLAEQFEPSSAYPIKDVQNKWKKKVKKTLLTIWGTIVLLGMGTCLLRMDKNTQVDLPGYKHATVLCGTAIMIDYGHFEDPEVQQLMDLAKTKCP